MHAVTTHATGQPNADQLLLDSVVSALKDRSEIHTRLDVSLKEAVQMETETAQTKASVFLAGAKTFAMMDVDQTRSAASKTDRHNANVCQDSFQALWIPEHVSETVSSADQTLIVLEEAHAKLDNVDMLVGVRMIVLLESSAVTVCV